MTGTRAHAGVGSPSDRFEAAQRQGDDHAPNLAILSQLRRPIGASIAQLQKATGWQPHSIRATLTGLRKQGHAVLRGKNTKGVTTYRVAKGA